MASAQSTEIRADGRLRLPPGQRLTPGWPVLHYGSIPRLDTESWRFHVWGLVEEERSFDWETFNEIGQVEEFNDIHCVTTWSKYDNTWKGIPFKALFDAVKVKPEASHAMLHCYGGYTTNVPVTDLLADQVMFAHTHDGELLSPEHGGPIRLVVPHLYFWKSAKWVGGIQFLSEDRPGFWETYGYHMYGDPWKEQRYT